MGKLGKSVTQGRKIYSDTSKIDPGCGLIAYSLRLASFFPAPLR